MKYIFQRNGRIFFESDSFEEFRSVFDRLINKLIITYMSEGQSLCGKNYDVFCCADGYTFLIGK